MARRSRTRIIIALAVFPLAYALASLALPGAIAPAAAPLSEAQDVNGAPDVVAEIVQCKREAGVLSIRMRLRNTGDKNADFYLVNNNYDQFYVTAGSKKYFVLRDSEKVPLANPVNVGTMLNVKIPKGGSYVWYAKYPAPPEETKKINYYTPVTPPFEDVAVSD